MTKMKFLFDCFLFYNKTYDENDTFGFVKDILNLQCHKIIP